MLKYTSQNATFILSVNTTNGTKRLNTEGEKLSADYASTTVFVEQLNVLISTENLTSERIYNGDETGLF